MGATFYSTQHCQSFLAPARAYGDSLESLEVGRDVAAGVVGTVIGPGLGIVYQHIEIYGQTQPHLMHGCTRRPLVSGVRGVGIRLGVDQMSFNIP